MANHSKTVPARLSAILQSDSLFRKLVENSFSGITLLDEKLNIIYRSPSAQRIGGWDMVSRLEISIEDLTHPDDRQLIKETIEKVFVSPGLPIECTFRTKHYHGHYIWLEASFTNMFHEQDINAIVCNFKDVSAHKEAEDKLKQTVQELSAYKYAIDESAIVAITDQRGIITHVNNNFCKISKYSRKELIGRDHRIINSGHHSKDVINNLWKTIANGNIWKGELKNRAKDGSHYWVDTTIVPFLNDKGKPYQYVAIRSDITERKQNEEKIIENARFIKTITDNIPAMVAYYNADLYCLFANKRLLNWFEMENEEMLGTHKQALMSKTDFETYMPYIQGVLKGKPQSFERTFIKPDGEKIYTHTQYLPNLEKNGIVKGFYSLIYDITEVKLAELEIKKQTAQVEYLLETITDGFIGLDANMCYTYANKQIGKMLGIDPQSLLGKNIWELFPEAVGSATYNAVIAAYTDGEFIMNEDYYEPLQLWQENRIYPTGGGLSIFIRDITQRKEEEHRLRLLESVITHTTDAVIITEAEPLDEPGPRMIYINEAFTKMTGYTMEDMSGQNPRILQGPNSDMTELKRLSIAMRSNEPCEITTANYKKGGQEFFVNFSVSPVKNDKGRTTHFISIERDVTQLKQDAVHKEELSAAIKASLAEKNTILESIADAFFAVDKEWMVTYWNKIAAQVLMKTKEEMLGHNLWEVFADSTQSRSYIKYNEAVNSRKPVHFEDYYDPLNKWYEVSAYPSETGLSVYFKDITDRKLSEILLKTSEKKYSELFNLSPLPMFLFDPETLRFLDVNDAAIKNYGYSRKEFMNITVKDIRPVDDMELFDKVLNENKKKNHFTHLGIYRHQKKNGEMIQVDLLTNVIKYKGKDAKIVVANDVTQRSKYIKAIEDQNQKLREISWIQSHIVRAPLSRILGLIPLINDAKEDSEDRDAMLKYLASSANDLDDVIKSITEKTSKADYDMRLDS